MSGGNRNKYRSRDGKLYTHKQGNGSSRMGFYDAPAKRDYLAEALAAAKAVGQGAQDYYGGAVSDPGNYVGPAGPLGNKFLKDSGQALINDWGGVKPAIEAGKDAITLADILSGKEKSVPFPQAYAGQKATDTVLHGGQAAMDASVFLPMLPKGGRAQPHAPVLEGGVFNADHVAFKKYMDELNSADIGVVRAAAKEHIGRVPKGSRNEILNGIEDRFHYEQGRKERFAIIDRMTDPAHAATFDDRAKAALEANPEGAKALRALLDNLKQTPPDITTTKEQYFAAQEAAARRISQSPSFDPNQLNMGFGFGDKSGTSLFDDLMNALGRKKEATAPEGFTPPTSLDDISAGFTTRNRTGPDWQAPNTKSVGDNFDYAAPSAFERMEAASQTPPVGSVPSVTDGMKKPPEGLLALLANLGFYGGIIGAAGYANEQAHKQGRAPAY